jgi:hypothetical protein
MDTNGYLSWWVGQTARSLALEGKAMRTTAKMMMTALFTAGLLGMGFGTASAGENDTDVYQACVQEQGFLGLINLDLDLLNQCISNHVG